MAAKGNNFELWIQDNLDDQTTTFHLVEELYDGVRVFYWPSGKMDGELVRFKEEADEMTPFPKKEIKPFLIIPLRTKRIIMECFMKEAQNRNYKTPNHDYMQGQLETLKLNADRTHEVLMGVIGMNK